MNVYDPNYTPKESYFLLVVKIILYDTDGNILLLQRSEKSPRPHGWDFAGGGVDAGEDPSDAAKREVLEETGLQIAELELLSTFHGRIREDEYVAVNYCAVTTQKSIELSWEHEEYQWTTPAQVNSIELPELHKSMLNEFINKKHPTQANP